MVASCRGITFTQLSDESALSEQFFPSVPASVLRLVANETCVIMCQKVSARTLTLACVMPDQADMFEQIALVSPFQGALFIIFIMVGSLIIMNMLLGARKILA